jgi:hypothetical protein
MATLLEILKAQGATEADLEQMKPLLGNPKFASAIENEITAKAELERKVAETSGKLSEFESQRNQFEVKATEAEKLVGEYKTWYDTQALPGIAKLQQDAIREAEKRAAAEAKMAKAKELYGFEIPEDTPVVNTTVPTTTPVTAAPGTTPRQDLPDMNKYVTADYFNQQADAFGQALASTQDLAFEHMQLFGADKPVNFTALREKAVAEKRPVKEIWEREMNVAGRRQEIQAKREADAQAKRDAEIAAARQEGFEKGMSQSINPTTREPMPSRFGVSFTKRDASAGKPWEAGAAREQDRLQKVVSTLAKQGAA